MFVVFVAAVLAAAGDTLGYDYRAYDAAVRRLLAGGAIYVPVTTYVGPSGLFLYPPTFAVALVPFVATLSPEVAVVAWTALLVVAVIAAVALLPVRREVRWLTLLLAGLMWPVSYAIKLGQVTPALLLLFAIGWRRLARDSIAGVVPAVGTLVKLQPAVLFGWLLLARRWRAFVIAFAIVVAASGVAILVVGPQPWLDYGNLLVRVNQPVSTPHNFSPGAIALANGANAQDAVAVQAISVALVVLVAAFCAVRRPPVVGYLAAVVASQVLSPILWDHYATLLLLPVAWLLDRGAWWAALVPLALSLPLVDVTPAAAYPIAFLVVLAMLVAVSRDRTQLPAVAFRALPREQVLRGSSR